MSFVDIAVPVVSGEPVPQVIFRMEAGESWTRQLLVTIDGQAPTFIAASMTVRDAKFIDLFDLSMTNGFITSPAAGTLLLSIPAADSIEFGNGFPMAFQAVTYWGIGRAYMYDLFARDSTETVTKICRGVIHVDPALTQSLP